MSSVQSEPRITPIGAFLQINESPDGKYTVKEVAATESALPKVVNDDDRKEISINVGFMAVCQSHIVFPRVNHCSWLALIYLLYSSPAT